MSDDRQLIQQRPAEELRRLKAHVAAVREHPEVVAASEALDNAKPVFTLEAFRDGVKIDGIPCRMTIGTRAMLRFSEARCIGFGDDESPLSDMDIAHGVFLMADDMRDKAVSVVDDPEKLEIAVRKFMRGINIDRAALQMYEFLMRVGDAIGEKKPMGPDGKPVDTPSVWSAPDDPWSDEVDAWMFQYHVSRQQILWEIPLAFVVKVDEAMKARLTGKRRYPSHDALSIAMLDTFNRISQKLQEEEEEKEAANE